MSVKFYSTKVVLLLFIMLGVHQLYAQTLPALEWYQNFGGRYNDEGIGMVTDKAGNIYTVGIIFNDTAVFDIAGQKVVLHANNGSEDLFITKQDPNGNYVWAKTIGGSGSDFAQSVAVDEKGGVYITGYFTEIINFNPPNNTDLFESIRGARNRYTADFFVCKLDTMGTFQWVRVVGSNIADLGRTVVYDPVTDAIVVTGEFGGSLDFGFGNAPSTVLTAEGESDIFVIKLNRDGDLIWATSLGGEASEFAGGVALDEAGNIYTTASYYDKVEFELAPNNTVVLQSKGAMDILITKMDKNGKLIWAKSIGGKDGEEVRGIAVSKEGNVHITGEYRDTVNFDPNGSHLLPAHGGASDIFILKLSTDGDLKWAKGMGAKADDKGEGIIVRETGDVYATGWFQGTRADFNPSLDPKDTFYLDAWNETMDAFIVKLDSTGAFRWAMNMGPLGRGHAIAYHNSNIFATGRFYDSCYFDPTKEKKNNLLKAVGTDDVYVIKLADCDANNPMISESDTICANQDYVYSVSGVPAAREFVWELPGTWKGNSTTNEITISADQSGIIKVTVIGLCDTTTVERNIDVRELQIDINVFGDTLAASTGFSSYQWLMGDSVIDGATDSKYVVKENGRYAVVVTNDEGCADTSTYYEVNNVSVAERNLHYNVQVYPNPAHDVLWINTSVPTQTIITTVEGKIIGNYTAPVQQIDLNGYAPGVYFLQLMNEDQQIIHQGKFIKQ